MGTQITTQKILAFDSFTTFPITGLDGYIYIDNLANIGYLWDAVANQYVNIGGIDNPTPLDPAPLAFANAATVGVLSYSPTYNNGTSGVGATLTATLPGVLRDTSAIGKIDTSYTPVAGDVILVKNQTGGISNGLYVITTVGSVSTSYVLTRFTDFDQSAELYPLQVNVINGVINNLKYFIQTTINPIIGTSNLIFSLSTLQQVASQIAFIDTVIDTPLSNIVYADGTAFPTIPGSGATLTSTVNGALGTYYGLTANTNSTIALGFTRVLLINQTNPAYNGDYQVINAGSASTRWQLRRINISASGFNRYIRYFAVSNASSTKAGKVYFTKPNSPVLTNATIGTAAINIFEYGGGGLDIGTTPITSGTVGRILFQGTGNVAQQDSTLFWDNTNKQLGLGTTTPAARLDILSQGALSTDIVFRIRNSANTVNILQVNGKGQAWSNGSGFISSNTSYGELALNANTTGINNTAFGYNTLTTNTVSSQQTAFGWGALQLTTGAGNTAMGFGAGQQLTTGTFNTSVGYSAGGTGASTQGVFVGYGAGQSSAASNAVCIGYTAGTNAGNGTIAIGYNSGAGTGLGNISLGQNSGLGMTTGFFNIHIGTRGVVSGITTGSYNTVIGTDIVIGNVSNNVVLSDGQGNKVLWFNSSNALISDLKIDTTTGIKFGTATNNKIGFWNATPIVQPTTSVAASTIVINTSGLLNDTATFDGYTIGQVVKALRNLGILA